MTQRNKGYFVMQGQFPASFIEETKKLAADKCGHVVTDAQALQIIEFWLKWADILNSLQK